MFIQREEMLILEFKNSNALEMVLRGMAVLYKQKTYPCEYNRPAAVLNPKQDHRRPKVRTSDSKLSQKYVTSSFDALTSFAYSG